MVFPKARMVVSGTLFLAWIGFLAFLAARHRDPIVLSRPQILVSNLCVVAQLAEANGRPVAQIAVKRVLWSASDLDKDLAGAALTVDGLRDHGPGNGWEEPGEYLLPLTKRAEHKTVTYQVTPLPWAVPGYRSSFVSVELVAAGPKKDDVASVVAKVAGVNLGEAKDLVAKAPVILRHNVAFFEADTFKKRFDALEAKARFPERESRIYQATNETLRQFFEIRP